MAWSDQLQHGAALNLLAYADCKDVISVGITCKHWYQEMQGCAAIFLDSSGFAILGRALPLQRFGIAQRFDAASQAALSDTSALVCLSGIVHLIENFNCMDDCSMRSARAQQIFVGDATVALMHSKKAGEPPVPVTVSCNVLQFHGASSVFSWHHQMSNGPQVKMVTAGRHHVLIVLVDGPVLSFGHTSSGALGHDDVASRRFPTEILTLRGEGVAHAAAGYDHSVFVTAGGKVLSCGRGNHGQLGLGYTGDVTSPQCVEKFAGRKVAHCAAAVHISGFLLRDGSAWTCGSGRYGMHGHGHKRNVLVPQRISRLCPKVSGFINCCFGQTHGLLLSGDCITSSWSGRAAIRASVFGVGSNGGGQLGHLIEHETLRPKELCLPSGLVPIAIAVSSNASLVVVSGGQFLVVTQGIIQRCSVNEGDDRVNSTVCQQINCSTFCRRVVEKNVQGFGQACCLPELTAEG
mmetsp:Transcript_10638/g.20620  ORF Transcript_10638/g.20620 Transcript_10638/m.20620 type:complete len:463 (+) Transcript_10638:40-1428(+)